MKTRCSVVLVAIAAFAGSAFAQPGVPKAVPLSPNQPRPIILPPSPDGPGPDLSWSTIDGGGGSVQGAGYLLSGTIGQPDAGFMSGNGYELGGGYWNLPEDPPACYANCDGSTGTPMLTPNDFTCFVTAYAAGAAYANCDGSSTAPVLTANDFVCFINAFASNCT